MIGAKNYFTLLLLLYCWFDLAAQNEDKEIKKDITLFSNSMAINSDSAYFYIQRAHTKSLVLKNDSLLARTCYNLGYYYYLKNKVDSSKIYLKKGLEFSIKSNFKKIQSLTYNQQGIIATDEGKLEKGLKFYLVALDIAEKYNLYENKSRVLINLGNLSVSQKDTLKALNYFNQNISNAIKFGFNNELISGYMNSAILYARNNKNKAIDYYSKALLIAKKSKNNYAEYSLNINLSELYLRYKSEKALQKVYYHLQQAKFIQQKLNDASLLFFLNFNFGGYYKNKAQFPIAIAYYKKALNTATKNTPSNQILNLYYTLSDAYAQNNDYKNALLVKEKQFKLSDSLFTVKKNKTFNEIQTKYEVDKKNLKIQLLTKDKIIESRRKQIVIAIAIIVIVFLSIALFLYKQRIKTQKIIAENENKLHQQEVIKLENEKELKRILGVVEGQDQERNRLAQDIHDGIGGALAGIKLELSQVNSTIKNNKIDQIIIKMQTAFNDLRSISHDLSINSLKEKEFDFLLNKLKEEYKNRGEFDTEIIVFPENSMNDVSHTIRYQLYRIIQELFTNTSKHAGASKVVLSCTVFDEQINIIFEDNGSGFDFSKETGIGLRNIQERLSILNGTIIIESNQGKGTTIIIDILLHDN